MNAQEITAATPVEWMQLVVAQQKEILDRLDRMERAQALSLTKEAYTTDEAAERLGRRPWTVRDGCNKGQVPGAIKIRGKGRTDEWRLTHTALMALQANGPSPVGTYLAA